MTIRRLLQVLTALLISFTPALAAAYPPSAIARAVDGTPFDPTESSIWVTPPQGGAVMIYEGGNLKGWFIHPGAVTVTPNRVYGVLATRGTAVMFHSGLLVGPGVTELAWSSASNRPVVGFQPAFPSHAHAVGTRVRRPAAAAPAPTAPAARSQTADKARPAPKAQPKAKTKLRRDAAAVRGAASAKPALARSAVALRPPAR